MLQIQIGTMHNFGWLTDIIHPNISCRDDPRLDIIHLVHYSPARTLPVIPTADTA